MLLTRLSWGAEINEDKMGGVHSTHRSVVKYIQNFGSKNVKEKGIT